MNESALPSPRVGLFVTCLADLFRPTVGFAALGAHGPRALHVIVVGGS